MTMRAGLCSVTFRQLTAEEVVRAAADAGLAVIEWGGDLHVPPGDAARAAQVRRATEDAGLAVCSYGSYFRPLGPDGERGTAGGVAHDELTPILDSAEALGTDRVRIWAGGLDSADASPRYRAHIVSRLQDAADEASARGIGLALEFHSRTLADTPEATLRLIAEVARPNLSAYWQPTVDAPDDVALAEYTAIEAHVSAVHVFSWWPAAERLLLSERSGLWKRLFDAASASATPPRDALLEFVPGDDPALLASEAATLLSWIDGARASAGARK